MTQTSIVLDDGCFLVYCLMRCLWCCDYVGGGGLWLTVLKCLVACCGCGRLSGLGCGVGKMGKAFSNVYTYIYIYIYIYLHEQKLQRLMQKPLLERLYVEKCCRNHGKRYSDVPKAITWFDGEVESCRCFSQPCGIV